MTYISSFLPKLLYNGGIYVNSRTEKEGKGKGEVQGSR